MTGSGASAPAPASALEATIRLAHTHGFSRARLTLKPAELGSVEVVLHSRGDGVSASVVADTPQAARLLEGAGAELRRRLDAQGVQLTGISISVAHDAAAGGAGAGEGGRDPAVRQAVPGAAGGPRATEEPGELTRTIDLGGGVLVDVLA